MRISRLKTLRRSNNKFRSRSKTKPKRRSLLRSKRLPKPRMLTSSSALRPTSKSKDVVAVVATVATDVEAVVVTVATDVVAVVVTSSPVVTVPRPPRMASAVVEIAVVVAVATDHKLPSPSLLMVKKLLKALLNAAVAMASVSVVVTASVAMATKASPVRMLTPWTVRTVLDVADAVTERTETAEVAEATMPSPMVTPPKNPRMRSQRENARSVNLVRKRKKSPLRKSKKSDSLLTITWQLSKLRALANLPRRKLVLTKPWMLRLLSSPRNTTLLNKSNLPPRSTLKSTPSLLAPLLILSSSDSRLLLMLVMSLMLVASAVVVVVTDPARKDPNNNPVAVKVARLLSMTTISPPYDQ